MYLVRLSDRSHVDLSAAVRETFGLILPPTSISDTPSGSYSGFEASLTFADLLSYASDDTKLSPRRILSTPPRNLLCGLIGHLGRLGEIFQEGEALPGIIFVIAVVLVVAFNDGVNI